MQAREFGHGIQCPGCTKDVDIEHSDERIPHLAIGIIIVHSVPNAVDGPKRHDFLEERKRLVARVGVWERGERSSAGPGDDGRQEDTDQDCALDTVHHEEDCQKAERVI